MSTTTAEHELVELTRAKAAANPDFVYEKEQSEFGATKCVYVRDGKPSCLIGHAALEGGFIDLSIELRGQNDVDVTELMSYAGIYDDLSYAELTWLAAAQEAQDTGQTWAEAIKSADEARAEYIEAELDHDDDD